MKKQKLQKKLSIKKETIVVLQENEMNPARGGFRTMLQTNCPICISEFDTECTCPIICIW